MRYLGLIPAHVGKTACATSCSGSWWAHPRSRGENTNVYRLNIGCDGSSPLTWGKLAGHHDHHRIAGLIPAHVGKTAASAASEKWAQAHPRSRGENARSWRTCSRSLGSSPLTWGKHGASKDLLAALRLIPAHVGKTVWNSLNVNGWTAHPRSRGENASTGSSSSPRSGSSPLTRGKGRNRRSPRT